MLLQQFVNGIVQGSTYSLMALGYSLIFGVLGLVNFAHGDVYMVAAFSAYFFLGSVITSGVVGVKLILALIVAIISSGILGIILEKVCFKRLRFAAPTSSCLATIGFGFVLKEITRLVFGAQTNRFIKDYSWVTYYHFGDIGISNVQILMIVVSIVLVISLQYILYNTDTGRSIRAVSQNKIAAQLMGVDIDDVISKTFVIGSTLAGSAGALVGLYYNAVFPTMGAMPSIKAYAATVMGGLGSIPGAAIGGLMLGVAENAIGSFFNSGWRDGVAFLVFFVVLVIKPTGLFSVGSEEKI